MRQDIGKQMEAFRKGAARIVSEEELVKKLERGKPLRIKLGVDPTAPDIHLGHTVVLRKLRQFQDLGHQAVLIIGDFTAMIGDPTGRIKTRPPLSPQEIKVNAETYLNQVRSVLDVNRLEVVNNAQWLSPISLGEFIRMAMSATAAKLLQREDFAKRLEQGIPIHFHELTYPFLQGYDSVHVRADVELGGTDQLLNILFGRDLQKDMGQESQVALVMPILVGTDGHDKMSKSLGNYIGVNEPAFEMVSKVMSIPDTLMKDYYTLLTPLMPPEIGTLVDASKTHPREGKLRLAREIASCYHSAADVDQALQRWEQVMSRKEIPTDIPELPISDRESIAAIVKRAIRYCESCKTYFTDPKQILDTPKGGGGVSSFLTQDLAVCPAGHLSSFQMSLFISNTAINTLIKQGSVKIDSCKITDPNSKPDIKSGNILCVSKKNKYFKLVTE